MTEPSDRPAMAPAEPAPERNPDAPAAEAVMAPAEAQPVDAPAEAAVVAAPEAEPAIAKAVAADAGRDDQSADGGQDDARSEEEDEDDDARVEEDDEDDDVRSEDGDGDDNARAEEEDEDDDSDEEDEEDAAAEADPPRVTFADLGLSDPIVRAVADAGYVTPTPIQEQAIPIVLMGRDVLGTAQTGTGKTAGFTLPMLDILSSGRAKARMPRSLILEPTRELALQVAEQFEKYGKHLKLNHALLIGGESMNEQREVLEKGVDVLIATPGRLLDLFDRGRILLADVKILVIDEADRMLDMGFIPDVERIVSFLPKMRQTLFFSATMAPEIKRLADAFLSNPKEIAVSAPASVATTIVAGLVWVRDHDKREALRRLIRREQVQNALIFSNRKVDVDILYKSLKKHGFSVGALHGDMDQPTRFATLNKFKANELQLLVCSDVAARGLDIGGLSHVFNFDVPFRDEDYVHRIGRTGRAGREGHAFTIAVADDARLVAAIEKLTGKPIPRIEIDGLDKVSAEEIAEAAARPRGRGRGSSSSSGARGRSSGGRDRGGRGDDRRDRGRSGGSAGGSRDGGSRAPQREDRPRAEAAPARERGPAREEAPRQDSGRHRDEAPRHRDSRGEEPNRHRDSRGDESGRHRDSRGSEQRGSESSRHRDQRTDESNRYRDQRTDESSRYRDQRSDESSRYRDYRGREEGPRRYRQEDLGPPVQGFGDAVPAFMLIPIPRPRRDSAGSDQDAEAA